MSILAIDQVEHAATALHPLRLRVLELLREPMSASRIAAELGLPRQQVNYHIKELERIGVVALVEERLQRNCLERLYRATAQAFVLAPSVLGAVGADPAAIQDRGSASYQMAVGSRLVQDHVALAKRGVETPTLTIETEIAFEDPSARFAFAQELAQAIAALARKYHVESGADRYRIVALAHPSIGEKP